jgi:hypothetical protein
VIRGRRPSPDAPRARSSRPGLAAVLGVGLLFGGSKPTSTTSEDDYTRGDEVLVAMPAGDTPGQHVRNEIRRRCADGCVSTSREVEHAPSRSPADRVPRWLLSVFRRARETHRPRRGTARRSSTCGMWLDSSSNTHSALVVRSPISPTDARSGLVAAPTHEQRWRVDVSESVGHAQPLGCVAWRSPGSGGCEHGQAVVPGSVRETGVGGHAPCRAFRQSRAAARSRGGSRRVLRRSWEGRSPRW